MVLSLTQGQTPSPSLPPIPPTPFFDLGPTCDGALAAAALGCKEVSKTGHTVRIFIPRSELLPRQRCLAPGTHQAFPVPGLVTVCHASLCQCLQDSLCEVQPYRSTLHMSPPPPMQGESCPSSAAQPHLAAAGTARRKLVLIAGHAVVSTLVGHEGTGAQRLLTAAAQEALLMPRLASIFELPGPCGGIEKPIQRFCPQL